MYGSGNHVDGYGNIIYNSWKYIQNFDFKSIIILINILGIFLENIGNDICARIRKETRDINRLSSRYIPCYFNKYRST